MLPDGTRVSTDSEAPGVSHSILGQDDYFDYVYEQLRFVKTEQQAVDVLDDIRHNLRSRGFSDRGLLGMTESRVFRLAREGSRQERGVYVPLDDDAALDRLLQADGQRIDDWRPLRVRAAVNRYTRHPPQLDVTSLGGGPPLISDRAAVALRDLLADHAQILPLDADPPGYWLLHPTRVLDALDEDRSTVRRFRDGGVKGVDRYVLRPDVITGVPMFKLPQTVYSYTYVNEEFVRTVEDAGLTGFRFPLVWSSSAAERP